jgi:hypothetical protein
MSNKTICHPKGYFPKGNIPWNKGLKGVQHHTPKSKRKLSLAFSDSKHPMFGKTHTAEAREKIRLNNILKGNKPPSRLGIKYTTEQILARSGPNNWNWKGGHSAYPLGWSKTFKEQIRQRDNYKCQDCGVHETDCIRKLDIHHKDDNKNNLSLDNLITLCRKCHAKTFHRKK